MTYFQKLYYPTRSSCDSRSQPRIKVPKVLQPFESESSSLRLWSWSVLLSACAASTSWNNWMQHKSKWKSWKRWRQGPSFLLNWRPLNIRLWGYENIVGDVQSQAHQSPGYVSEHPFFRPAPSQVRAYRCTSLGMEMGKEWKWMHRFEQDWCIHFVPTYIVFSLSCACYLLLMISNRTSHLLPTGCGPGPVIPPLTVSVSVSDARPGALPCKLCLVPEPKRIREPKIDESFSASMEMIYIVCMNVWLCLTASIQHCNMFLIFFENHCIRANDRSSANELSFDPGSHFTPSPGRRPFGSTGGSYKDSLGMRLLQVQRGLQQIAWQVILRVEPLTVTVGIWDEIEVLT